MTLTSIIGLVVISLVVFIGLIFGLRRLLKFKTSTLIIGSIGTLVGLLFAALITIPLAKLPDPYGSYLPLIVSVALVLGFVAVFMAKRQIIEFGVGQLLPKRAKPSDKSAEALVDTSVLIDGRIEDIARTGFVMTHLIIPRFVLDELQQIADSSDTLKRNRGRRGLEVLNKLTGIEGLTTEIIDDAWPMIKEVDSKLVKAAKERGAGILTNDFNLNKIAKIEGVLVLNINELANSVKTTMLPGELATVRVIQKGKEKTQGVGYLPDGTMIVVEGGADMIGQDATVEVTRTLQTAAGKMVFTELKK